MGPPARKDATYEDVLNAPEGFVAEILAGELHMSPRPRYSHAVAAVSIASDLDGPFRRGRGGPGGWWILPEPELHLGRTVARSVVAVPDVAGWRRERLPAIPDTVGFTVRPDWVCEIVSPGPANTRRDRVLKPAIYAEAQVPHLWLVDPVGQLLEVYRLKEGVYVRVGAFAGADLVRAEPFDAIEVAVGTLFGDDPPA